MKVQVYIEGQRLDLFEDEQINIRSSVQDVSDISKLYADYSQSFTVPASDTNNKIFSQWYNPDIDNGFDARTRVQATIDVDTLDFKRGKIRLDSVSIKNNKPVHYKLTFFGDIIKVKDLIGNDKLFDLDWLDNFDSDYSDAKVLEGISTGLDFTVDGVTYDKAVIYPLISYFRQFYYSSDSTDDTDAASLVNIAYNAVAESGIEGADLKTAIKAQLIIKAIEQKYGLVFTGDFFNSAEFTNLYMNLNNSTEVQAKGYKLVEENSGTITTDFLAVRLGVVLTPKAGFETVPYKVKTTFNDNVVYESTDFLTGNIANGGEIRYEASAGENFVSKVEVFTNNNFEFDVDVWLEVYFPVLGNYVWRFVTEEGYPITYSNQVVDIRTRITNELPEIKVYDFLTSLFKLANLVVTPDGDDVQINDLQSWYSAGAIHDVTKYIDTSSEEIKRGKIFNEINFKFEETDQVLADEYRQSNNQGYGDLEFKLTDSSGNLLQNVDGESLDIEVLFENPIYERLFDTFTGDITTIQYCLYTDRDIKAISGNPFLFYAPSVSVSGNTIGFKGASYSEISGNVFMPSHSLQIDADSFSLNFNAEINEYTYSTGSDTLYSRYYDDYITDIFSVKRRMFSFDAILPNSLLNTLQLNDRLVIRDRRYIINSISSNLVTRKDKLELINDIYDAPLASDVLSSSLFTPSIKFYNSGSFTDTAKYVGVVGSTISKVDTGYGTSWLTVTETVTTSGVQTINFSITQNNTGADRTVQIQVTDNINNPKFTIDQSVLVSFDSDTITFDNINVTFDQR